MSQTITLKSFDELAAALQMEVSAGEPAIEPQEEHVPEVQEAPSPPDIATLMQQLEEAAGTLAAVARRDQELRGAALRDLERYDEMTARQRSAEDTQARAQQLRRQAEALSQGAFAEEARAEAGRLVRIAVEVEVAAIDDAARWRGEAERLAAHLDLERLLEERRRQQEAENAKAAEAEKAGRLAGALDRARAALGAGRDEEAKGLLGHLAKDFPGNPEVSSLKTIIAQREVAVKVSAAEDALWEARRTYRHEPAEAASRLERLDVDGLPEPLARQVFGEWARACARLCRERELVEPLRYAPDPGHGAVLAREQVDGSYVVISALGMGASWEAGRAVSERYVRRARPLR